MKFFLLFYLPEGASGAVSELESFDEELRRRGVLVAAPNLGPVSQAETVRRQDGVSSAEPGAEAASDEQLFGLRIVECADQQEAVALAGLAPAARLGSVEVRGTPDLAADPDVVRSDSR